MLVLHRQQDHRDDADLGLRRRDRSNGWYHIIGFAGFQLTACEGGKNIAGVWRKQFFLGPTTGSSPGEFASLAVQLVK